ncbi:MAG TPA: HAD family hydrolase [Acidimicrobiales bacterium]|nr:HAD family hydrolase [Acidimicrobiales bacterium]
MAPADRIATFDNDGTLWCEKPQYVQAGSVFRRWRAMVDADPAKAAQQPYKALVENDQVWLSDLLAHVPELVEGVTEAYEGITVEAFEQAVKEFFTTAAHSTLGLAYTRTGYQPMRELLDFLDASGFRVFVCSGGGRDFIHPVSEQMHGIPRERVIGSAAVVQYRDGELYRTKDVERPIDDGTGKPEHIWMRTGRMPLVACGNADGDVPMLETARFSILVRYDDAEREFAYDNGAERTLVEAGKRGWTVVSIKDDFKTVFEAGRGR